MAMSHSSFWRGATRRRPTPSLYGQTSSIHLDYIGGSDANSTHLDVRYGCCPLNGESRRWTIFHGWAEAIGGATEAGIAELRQGLAAIQGIDVLQHTPTVLGLRAEPHVENMQPGEAIRCLDGALARVDRLAERWFEAELYRLKGDALLAVSPKHCDKAEASYQQARAVTAAA
jgi:hypothetical protein